MPALLPLFPEYESGPARPRGLAGLAAAAAPLDHRNVVEYAAIETRSILNRCTSARVPFEWTVNPYRGCEFGCQYCYARYTHEFMEMRGSHDFERQIFVKQGAGALLGRELRQVRPHERIAIGTATDPYQPAERHYQLTRQLLEVFAEQRGLTLGLVSKSTLIRRDIEVLRRISAHNRLHVSITVTTMDMALGRALEPRAPRPDLRLKAVAALSAAGISVGVMCAPVLPGITDRRSGLEAIAAAARAAGAASFHASPLFLQPAAQKRYFPFLSERFPHLLERYRRAYARSAYLPAAYRECLAVRVAGIRERQGFSGAERFALAKIPTENEDAHGSAAQLRLL